MMDAKARANFINSIGSGQKIPCPSCGSLNETDDAFCSICGTPLKGEAAAEAPKQNICPFCGEENDEDALFCGSCGKKMAIVPPPQAPAFAPAAETKPATPAFAPVAETKPAVPAFAPAAEPKPAAPAFAPAAETKPVAPVFAPATEPKPAAPAFTPAVKEEKAAEVKPVFNFVAADTVIEDEAPSAFAEGLPDWDMVPPQVAVRRKHRK